MAMVLSGLAGQETLAGGTAWGTVVVVVVSR
jgi:hypothetical protein